MYGHEVSLYLNLCLQSHPSEVPKVTLYLNINVFDSRLGSNFMVFGLESKIYVWDVVYMLQAAQLQAKKD